MFANVLQPLIDISNSVLVFLNGLGLHYGLAIVVLTFLTRMVILPLSIKQIKSMRAMSAIQPQVKDIQERYKDDRERMQREMMRVYQENGVNPFASCLPLLLQMPVFMTLFYLLRSDKFQEDINAAGQSSWLFINDLAEPATHGTLITLVALYVITSLGAGLIMTGTQASSQQRMMALGLPLIFLPIMIGFPAGLLVYWISTNFWTMGQQGVVKAFFPADDIPTADEVKAAIAPPPPPRKRKRRR